MKYIHFAVTLLALLLLLAACTTSNTPEPLAQAYTVNASIVLNDAWTVVTPQSPARKAPAETSLVYGIYLFGSNGQAITALGGSMTDATLSKTLTKTITSPGTYTFYGLTNVTTSERLTMAGTPTPVILTSTPITLDATAAPNDVCLGSQSLTVTANQNAYTTSITVSHIMSRLALTVKNVPSDITSLTIILPSQANVFDFTGTFAYAKDAQGNDTPVSQTLTLTKAASANQDGTYTWSCQPTIVFPCADGTTSMPLTITWGSATVTSKVVSTTSTTCCLSGKNLSLSTTWSEAYRTSATITTSDWSALEEGTFSW